MNAILKQRGQQLLSHVFNVPASSCCNVFVPCTSKHHGTSDQQHAEQFVKQSAWTPQVTQEQLLLVPQHAVTIPARKTINAERQQHFSSQLLPCLPSEY